MGFELVGAFLLRDKGMASFMQETKQALIFVKLCIKTKFRATRRRRAVYLPWQEESLCGWQNLKNQKNTPKPPPNHLYTGSAHESYINGT